MNLKYSTWADILGLRPRPTASNVKPAVGDVYIWQGETGPVEYAQIIGVYVEAAQVLAKSVVDLKAENDAARLDFVFRRGLARPASEMEQEKLLSLLAESQSYFEQNVEQAKKLTGEKDGRPEKLATTAAWVAVCRIILNFDEFLSRE